MSEKFLSANSDSYESNVSTAEEMAYVQENYQRVNAIKESLGLDVDENPVDTANELTAQKQDDIRQARNVGEALAVKQGREAIDNAITGSLESNLRANGVEVNEYGKIVEDESRGITENVAEAASRIINRLPNIVVNQTNAEMQHTATNESVDGWMKVNVFNSEGKNDVSEDDKVQRLAIEAAGLHPDAVNSAPYMPGEITSGGWNSQVKIIPTELPGVFYKEEYFTPPANKDAEPIRKAEFTTIVPEGSREELELAA